MLARFGASPSDTEVGFSYSACCLRGSCRTLLSPIQILTSSVRRLCQEFMKANDGMINSIYRFYRRFLTLNQSIDLQRFQACSCWHIQFLPDVCPEISSPKRNSAHGLCRRIPPPSLILSIGFAGFLVVFDRHFCRHFVSPKAQPSYANDFPNIYIHINV